MSEVNLSMLDSVGLELLAIVRELAGSDPWDHIVNPDTPHCRHCMCYERGPHDEDCLWLRAQKFVEVTETNTSV